MDAIYSKLKVTEPGPSYAKSRSRISRTFFNQLASEGLRTRFVRSHPMSYQFKPSGKRKQPLDRRVYALAALDSRPVPWEVLLRAVLTEPLPSSPLDGGGPLAPPPSSPLPVSANRFQRRQLRFRMR